MLPNLDDPYYYVQIFQGIEKAFSGSSYFLNITCSDDVPELERQELGGFLRKQICGLILLSWQPGTWRYCNEDFTSKGCPIVMTDRRIKSLDANYVSVDSKIEILPRGRHVMRRSVWRSSSHTRPTEAMPSFSRGVWISRMSGPSDTQSSPGSLPASRPHSTPPCTALTRGSLPHCSR